MRRTKEGLSPFENDKPKDAGISLFQAGSDNTPTANRKTFESSGTMKKEEKPRGFSSF